MLEAIAIREILESKRESWQKYLGKVNQSTRLSEVWNIIRALSGKKARPNKIILTINGSCSEPQILSNTFGTYFAQVSSTNNYSQEFIQYKTIKEGNVIVFPPDDGRFYNKPFTIRELEHAIKNTTSTSPGPDDIHYDMLKNLPLEQELNLLR